MKNGFKGFVIFILLVVIVGLIYYKKYIKVDDVINVDVQASLKKQYENKDYVIDTSNSAGQIKLPYFNVVSKDADIINDKITNIYEYYKDESVYINYRKYEYKDIVFVLISVTGDNINEYYTFNISTSDGCTSSYSSVYKKLRLNKTIIEAALRTKVDSEVVEEVVSDYKNSVLNDSIKYYVEDGILTIIVNNEIYKINQEGL